MTTSEMSLLDTNILVYAADRNSSYHEAALLLRDKGLKGESPVCVCPQVLNEFFAIITDPKRANNPRTQYFDRRIYRRDDFYKFEKSIMCT